MRSRMTYLLLAACLLVSGAAGLIYEVAWARYLAVLFGNTTYAYTVVLATFMGGMALGSLLLGRIADRARDRLLLFSMAELGIAVSCALTPRLFLLSRTAFLAAARRIPPHSPALVLPMFAVGALIMLVPTLLMGGTLPILGAAMTASRASRGRLVARLYYVNCLGAVLGTVLAGAYLIRRFGLGPTVVMAAALNLLAGAVALGVRFRAGRTPSPLREDDAAAGGQEEPAAGAAAARVALIAVGASGFAAMLYELVWVRLLSLVLGSSTYSFSAMLATFILGITLGSFLVSRSMPRARGAFAALGLCEACIGLSLIVSIPFYERLPAVFLRLSDVLDRKPETFMLYEATKLCVSSLVMLPPTIFLGMTVPLASAVVSRPPGLFGRDVGGVLAMNTTGNILGALATGLLLIPLLGLQRSLEIGVIINLCLGALILCMARFPSRRRRVAFLLLCGAAFVAYRALIPDWNRAYFTVQAFRGPAGPGPVSESLVGDRKILYDRDGLNASVAVVQFEGHRTLFVNGKADASSGGDMSTQRLLAAIPLILRPSSRDLLVIGLGSGVTCGTALRFPVARLDVVELSREVVEASAYFALENDGALGDPRLRLHVEDARTFIQRTGGRYDLIISEPSNPWMSGVGDLFSAEHFGDCLAALREDGVMAQWVHLYEMDDETLKIVIKTFSSVFPDVTLWTLGKTDMLLMGTRNGLAPDYDEAGRIMAVSAVRDGMAPFLLHDLFGVLSLQMGSNVNVRESVRSEPLVNSDFHPLLEYRAARALYTRAVVGTYLTHLDERKYPLERNNLLLGPYLRARPVTRANLANLLAYLEAVEDRYSAYLSNPVLHALRRLDPGDRHLLAAYLASEAAPLQENILAVERAVRGVGAPFELLKLSADLHVRRYFLLRSFLTPEIYAETIEALGRCARAAEDRKAEFYRMMGNVSLHQREYREAFSYYRRSKALSDDEP
ncbi:MAG: fused MFS/spermidine synthase [bacterium]|nr:fused MFS/spermidine synthase [bacterium]